ncbi:MULTISPECIES: formylglycine-generating enzyme family protein [unclassified Microcystis]|nr:MULTISPECIES: formylglycine-generating enzyme family protein [unclassified Microcystis]MCA2925890.1 formylglycine-generating enzyme family protein [Microcystis sp. M020S1]MCA2620752.1 formylglycine-generating enzyme family protein [Microcystis sp. M099S2]MCA2649414.1 formylglycine-generating enzyme family protein [Microcystis sp. M065S2]MCA2678575.1 formylglycine-generating enzyme family protein [Microcystis sp. M043S2]MCA2696262.1 formylglycine-generating enzyme family protein [Microcystis
MSESPSNSSIKKLLDYLEQTGLIERLQLSDEDVADSIWLALQMGVEDLQPPPRNPENKQPIDSSTSNEIEKNLEDIPEDNLSKSQPNIDVITEESLPQEIEKTTPIQGFPFQVPAAAALQTALPISRALRPFMGKVPSAIKTILDEEATASFIAERDIWLPVTKPQPERWLTLELVVEESRSSFIWRELINELQNLLENQGAFKTVRVWQISTSNNQELQLVRRRKKAKPEQRYHSHKELIHPRGQGLVLLVSDCVSPLWQKALIHPWLKDWSEKQPTAILQLFPERLWNSTQLGRGRKLFTTALTAGVPNPKLILKNYPQWLPINWQNTLLIPVITLEIEVLKQWAKVVAGSGNAQISAFLFDLEFIKQQIIEIPPISREENKQDSEDKNSIKNKAEAMVERFFATASEPAKKLAKMMAAAPVSMQVVNLIRKTLLNEVRPVHVAEFYMGGLLKPIVENEEGQYRVYDFLPGVRQVLNDAIGRRQTIKVLDAISQYIAGEIKSPIRSFAALLTLLPTYPPEQREKILPFAQVSIEVLGNLGGEYAEFAEKIAVNISNPLPIPQPSEPPLKTRTFEFIVATIERQSRLWGLFPKREKWVIKKEKRQAKGIVQKLAEGVELELMEIPGGTFTMGTEDEEIERLVKKFGWEGFRSERPQHRVTVSSFYMGRYPITQAQWRAVASRTDLKVERNLNPDPSHFKDPPKPPLEREASDSPPFEGARGGSPTRWDRPVEQVSWYDAVEFCARLSKLTGKEYRLPSEAEWEYACRAGTTTPFHFGETITGELANYDARKTYADEPKGEYRRQTTPVGQFPPNAFGLYDMHGNVWEWCLDPWHENYQGEPPRDGSVWDENNNDNRYQSLLISTKELLTDKRYRVLRGGSWNVIPLNCRSAYRNRDLPVILSNFIGFRVACVSPGL